ncbi:rhodanese-like domain-containing protein [Catelliglobosispora koreensis]|uniref:rhodanese-like domain-containing protein n=1 Tax=Catelliglobosispora koreensis TaxID=129052 RepID=UPI0003829A6E|nr:rhodanese-like domain-containing protein [Catelliglobosispora koreensis]
MEISQADFARARQAGDPVIDVRTNAEYASGHVPGALSIPLDDLTARLAEVPAGRVQVICASGNRSKIAVSLLRRAGRDAWSVTGGTAAWAGAGNRVTLGATPA